MQSQLKVLIVEDVPTDAELALRELGKMGLAPNVVRVETEAEYLRQLDEFAPDIILCDYTLPNFDGLSALRLARDKCPDTPFIFVSGTIGEEVAIEALKRGAVDYVLKTNLKRLGPAVERALQDVEERQARLSIERQLNEARIRFELFMRYLPGAAFIKDARGRYQFVNWSWEEIRGRKMAEVLGRTDGNLWPELAAQLESNERLVIDRNEPLRSIETFPRPDGVHHYLVHKFPIRDKNGQPVLVGGVSIDFTDRLRAEEKVARLSRIHAVLSGINSAIVRIRNREELFREASRIAVEHGKFVMAWIGLIDAATRAVIPVAKAGRDDGYLEEIKLTAQENVPGNCILTAEALTRRVPVVCNDIAADDRMSQWRTAALKRGYRSVGLFPLLLEQQAVGILVLYASEPGFFDEQEMKLLIELAGDVSFALEVMEKEKQLTYLAYHDVLTGLPNLQLLHDRLAQAVNAPAALDSKVALMVSDVERFSMLNDTLGKAAGDAVLKTIAARLGRECDPGDTLARIGSDSFAVILNDVDALPQMVRALTENFTATVPRASGDDPGPVSVKLRWGVAIHPDDGAGPDQLMGNAQAALRSAQESREDCVFYAPQMNARVAEMLSLENKLRIAIADQQFVLHYQPKVDLATNRILGLEALIRWDSPELGLVPPYKFIPILEETGMILEVGTWVLRQAAQQQRQWRQQGLKPARIAVNISSLQLRHQDFIDEVMSVVARDKDDPAQIDLEITESVIMSDIEQCIPKLKAIRETGFGIEIDDFGTGYSSLSYIAKLPVTALKIDRSFVNDMASGGDSLSIISTIISLAHALNLTVVAEGVETEAQRDLLKMLKCDAMQGYLFCKPLPAAEIEALLRA